MSPAVLQSRIMITVYSIGWSDVPDYAENLLGFVFDLEQVGRDADGKGRRWNFFGGCSRDLDRELEEMWPLAALAELIMNLLSRYFDILRAAAAEDAYSCDSFTPIIIALICAWGKHRSRWLAERLGRWLAQLDDFGYAFLMIHLSDRNRMLEVRHANKKERDGSPHYQAIQSAKHMGLRRKRGEFENIKLDLYRKM